MTTQEIEIAVEKIEAAFGAYRCTDERPCAGVCHYDEGEELPWRISDDWASESYATAEEAEEAAKEWAALMLAEENA